MPGLVPGIHVFTAFHGKQDVDGRDEPGHDRIFAIEGFVCVMPALVAGIHV